MSGVKLYLGKTTMDPESVPTSALAQRCKEETDKFKRNQPNNPEYCFQLFWRALAERSDEALSHVYRIYFSSLYKSIRYKFPTIKDEDIEHFFLIGLSKFVRELRSDKIDNFSTLAAIISYLNTCVYNVIKEYLRKKRVSTVPLDPTVRSNPTATSLDRGIRLHEIWARICQLIPDEKDQFLARRLFIEHLKPSQILEFYPNSFRDTEEIRIARQRIVRTLSRDSGLRDLLE